ncbi:exocyst complex component SEC10 [Scheffersomyces xylosifermentans]|uniref:exocyst complex component SEC10 n=1 Tax=Scheffersomyces xylosifermentans TaxID=1304137 RepID=UPI00315C9806
MSFSIYDLDENIKKLLNLDNFLNGGTVNDFIEEISKDHFLKAQEVNKLDYLDPKPYIRTFESTLRELKQLHTEANDQTRMSEKQVENYELKHSESVLQLSAKIDKSVKKFDVLDSRISEVTTKINPLGNSLNRITDSRDRSLETIFLIRAYHGFYTKEKYDPLETLRTSSKFEDKTKCAKTVRNLITLSKKIESPDLPKTTKCVQTIQSYSEMMERNLLNKFEVASEDHQFEIMRDIAKILFGFNGGANVVQTFVSKNDIILDPSQEEEKSILDDEVTWQKLSDPNFGEVIKDKATEDILDTLRFEIKSRARVIQQVFEDPEPVLKIFIQRIYAQIVQNKVNTLLQFSLSVSTLAHVRILHILYILVGDFTKDVKEFLATNEFDKENELSSILDQSFYDLFIEYTSDTVYFAREKKNLEEIIYEIVHKFNEYNEKEIANNYLSTKIENLDNFEYNQKNEHASNDRFSFHFSERKRLNQFRTYVKSKLSDKNARNSTDLDRNGQDFEEYSKLNITKVETILKSSIESIARILELAPNKAPDYALEILEIILFDFGKLYIGSGLEIAYDHLKQENVSSKINSTQQFNFDYLTSFNLVSEILFLISSCIKKIILPSAVNSPNIKNRMINLTNGFVSRCELSLNIILSETQELIAARIAFFLTKQKKKDFFCDTIEDDTEACELISDFLILVYTRFNISLNNTNLENVLVKVGMNFLNQLLEHYKKFTVNSIGGIVLTKDVIRYQSVIDEWDIPELSENFQLLKEIGNLFTVQAELINSLVTEGQLANLKPYTIRQYVAKRADFNPSYIERFFSLKH